MGLVGFITLPYLGPILPRKTQVVGIIGSHTVETLPIDIQNEISLGLTKVAANGEPLPSAALSFEAKDKGKTYVFVLRNDLFWQDGKKFAAEDINYNFKDVNMEIKSDREVVFTLKEPFAPFPTVLSQPLFRKGLIGLTKAGGQSNAGEYKVSKIKRSGLFVEQINLEGQTSKATNLRKVYKFYPNEEIARLAFMLGEIDTVTHLLDPADFRGFKNVEISKKEAPNQLVTVFYNTSFSLLSDKSVRQALTYALARDFEDGIAASSPLNRHSWAYVPQDKFSQDIKLAKKLLGESKTATQSGTPILTLTTTPKFAKLALRIKEAWEELAIETSISIVQTIPVDPQVLLEQFRIPDDPDQYVLWHSTQSTNISRFANPKIDKLLEDGRQIVNQEERLQIYADFQKRIVEEAPAVFLYYPTVYTISRK